jgi:hypothetical protein
VPALGSIGDRVWEDLNFDGIQDDFEIGMSDVTVRLYQDDGDGVFEPGGDDALLQTAITDIDGYYLFSNVDAGQYWVEAVSPHPLIFPTTPNPYGPINLAPGQNFLDADIGMVFAGGG